MASLQLSKRSFYRGSGEADRIELVTCERRKIVCRFKLFSPHLRRMKLMTPFLSKSVVLSIATLLALPPGWCCGMFQHVKADTAPEKTECCQHPGPEKPSDNLPATPKAECCCSHEAAIPAKAVEPTDTPSVVLFAVPNLGDLYFGLERTCDSVVLLFDPGPKLHILKCVWRC